jgi:hypothetical protein
MNNNSESNGNGTRLVWYALRVAIGILILGAGSWATYITSNITDLTKRATALERSFDRIDTKLDSLLEELKRGRR